MERMSKRAVKLFKKIHRAGGRPVVMSFYTNHAFELADYLTEWSKDSFAPTHATLNAKGERSFHKIVNPKLTT